MIGNIKNEEIGVNKTKYRTYSVFLAQKIIYQNNFSTIQQWCCPTISKAAHTDTSKPRLLRELRREIGPTWRIIFKIPYSGVIRE